MSSQTDLKKSLKAALQMSGTIAAQQWMVIYSLLCKPIYLSIAEV